MRELFSHKQQEQNHNVVRQQDNVDHFVRIQELFNRVQLDNKNLRQLSQKVESKLESKERLIDHLEDKVNKVMLDKEEIVIKLKSEIVLFKNQIEASESNFEQRLAVDKQKLERNLQKQYKDQMLAI